MPSGDLIEALKEQVVPAVLDRRSVHMLFEALWHENRSKFWDKLTGLMGPETPGLSRIAAAESLVRLAGSCEDLMPLWLRLEHGAERDATTNAIRFVSSFVAADTRLQKPLVWLRWSLAGVDSADDSIRASLAGLLFQIWRNRDSALDVDARKLAAQLARRLAESALQSESPLQALQLVVDTLPEAPAENAGILMRLFSDRCSHPQRDQAIDELTTQVGDLLLAPELVAALYARVLRVEADEEAEEREEFSRWYEEAQAAHARGEDGPPAVSRVRRSGIDSDYSLKQHFHGFVQAAPVLATRVIVEGRGYWDSRTKRKATDHITITVDGSELDIPNRSVGGTSTAMHLVEHLEDDLVAALGSAPVERRRLILRELVAARAPESVWANVISSAAHVAPLRDIAVEILGRANVVRIFSYPAADLIRGWGIQMPEVLLKYFEAIATSWTSDEDAYAKARIISALRSVDRERSDTGSSIVSHDGERRDEEEEPVLIGGDEAEDAFDMSRFNVTQEDLALASNKRLRSATRSAAVQEDKLREALQRKRADTALQTDDSTAAVHELREALRADDAHPAFVVTGWCTLSRIASLLAAAGAAGAPALVLECAARNDSLPWKGDGSFGDLLNAGQVIVRAESVRGLSSLAAKGDAHALLEMERLAKDVEPAVRFQTAWYLHELHELDAGRIWPLLERLINDRSVGVAAAAVRQLRPFYAIDRHRGLSIAAAALTRMAGGSDTERGARTDLMFQLSWYHLARNEEIATRAMERVFDEIPRTTAGLDRLLHSYRDWLTMGAEGEEPEAEARNRTVSMYGRIARECIGAIGATANRNPNAQQRSERGAHAQLLEHLAFQLYFASGAFRRKDGKEDLPIDTVVRFYADVEDLLVEIGLSGSNSAAEKVLETLEHFFNVSKETTKISSRRVLQSFVAIAEAIVRNGAANNFWSLGPIQSVLTRCVAERDSSLYDETILGAWGRIIDPLLDKGWKQAFQLARDLDVSR